MDAMSTIKEQKPKAVLFHISHSLFKNKRLKRRLTGKTRSETTKKRSKTKSKQHLAPPSETIEIISTDEEDEPSRQSEVETSIVLSSDDEDYKTTQNRIFPMLTSETTVQTAVGNTVYELSLTQLKENLETITKQECRVASPPNKRLRNTAPSLDVDISISLLSDDDDDGDDKVKTEGRPKPCYS